MECGGPDEVGALEVTPASGANGVLLDAYVQVLYTPGYLAAVDPSRTIEVTTEDGDPVAGEAQVVGDRLFFVPDALLDPDTTYRGLAFGFDYDFEFEFATTRRDGAVDSGPPTLGSRISDITSSRVSTTCEAPSGGYRVDVSFPPADDDGSPGSIEYLLYLTRGPTLDAPELRARARNFATSDMGRIPMAFVLTPEEAVSPVCVVVHAVDGAGNVDDDMEPRCFEPVQGNFFEALCSAAPGRESSPPFVAVALLGLVLWRRRR